MPGSDKLGTAWAEDRATQGCDLSAAPSADRLGADLTVAPNWACWPKSDKSRGFGGRAPIWKKGYLPFFEKTLTNGGESWTRSLQRDKSHPSGKAGPGGCPTILVDWDSTLHRRSDVQLFRSSLHREKSYR